MKGKMEHVKTSLKAHFRHMCWLFTMANEPNTGGILINPPDYKMCWMESHRGDKVLFRMFLSQGKGSPCLQLSPQQVIELYDSITMRLPRLQAAIKENYSCGKKGDFDVNYDPQGYINEVSHKPLPQA